MHGTILRIMKSIGMIIRNRLMNNIRSLTKKDDA